MDSPDFPREEQARSKTPEAGGSGGPGGDKERATVVTSEGGVVIQQEEERKAGDESSFMDRVQKIDTSVKASGNYANIS
jgi:hypothetical protein